MKFRVTSLLPLVSFLSCNTVQLDNKKSQLDSPTFTVKTNQTGVKPASLKDKIVGIWGGEYSENAVFDIRKDSIYNVDQFKTYKYSLKDSIITIFYPDFIYSGKVSFIKDTMVMESDGEKSKFWKFIK